jgi:16S rRNA (uracil1498-N3)-methyltransferase
MLTLFFVPEITNADRIEVSGEEAHHALKVLRIAKGEEIHLSDGKGSWVRAKVSDLGKRTFEVTVLERGASTTSKPKLTVLQGIPKSDRVKEAIEMMTEAGVDEIVAWNAERSISRWQDKSQEKWESGALAAAKQARRFFIPKISSVEKLPDYIASVSGSFALIVLHEGASVPLSKIVTPSMADLDEIILVIGPEGGITPHELEVLEQGGARTAKMGEIVFRSAHAGGAALSAISALTGKW